jgi:L-ribulose-5-phosphate 3-epimerase
MIPVSLAVATRHFGMPLRRAIEYAGSMGAQGVQLDVCNELPPGELSETGRRQFKHSLRERLLSISSFEFPTLRSFYDQQDLDAQVFGLKSALQFAYQMGVRIVVGRIGRIPEDVESKEYELLIQVLNDIARHSNQVGATFAFTPNADSTESIKTLIGKVTEGPIGINLDPGGMAMNGMSWVETYRELYDRVTSVQVRDGIRDIDGQGVEVAVGRGEVAWDECLALLHEGSFEGWLTATRSGGDDSKGDLARAIQFIKNVGTELG